MAAGCPYLACPRPLFSKTSSSAPVPRTTAPLVQCSDDNGSDRRLIPHAEHMERRRERTRGHSNIDHEHLVLAMVDLSTQSVAELDELTMIQLAEEHAVLNVLTKCMQRGEYAVASLVIGNVVRY
jgi:hypothetical protein